MLTDIQRRQRFCSRLEASVAKASTTKGIDKTVVSRVIQIILRVHDRF